MQIEERVAKIEGIIEQMNERLNHIETSLRSNFKWTIGIMITMWVTIILTIIFHS
jgi:tetrahydromethanopterin S-methyltransferase subunit B